MMDLDYYNDIGKRNKCDIYFFLLRITLARIKYLFIHNNNDDVCGYQLIKTYSKIKKIL